jgi:hypothetical protein
VDDLAANIEGAKKVGMHGLLYEPGAGLRQALRGLGVRV